MEMEYVQIPIFSTYKYALILRSTDRCKLYGIFYFFKLNNLFTDR